MTNRLVHYLQGCIHALFKDMAWMYTSELERMRDLDRTLIQLESRGVGFLTLDLPALEKNLHRYLADGRLVATGFMMKTRNRKTHIPCYMESVYSRIFSKESGVLVDEPCPGAILALKTLFSFAKRIRLACPEEKVDEAIKTFIATDQSLPKPNYDWDCDYFDNGAGNPARAGRIDVRTSFPERGLDLSGRDLETIQLCFNIAAASLGASPSIDGELQRLIYPRHGPGAVSEGRLSESKYELSNWPDRLQRRFPIDWYGRTALGQSDLTDEDAVSTEIRGSRLIAVPKTMKGPRLIAAEPIHNQWIQQYIWRALEYRIHNNVIGDSISFRDQPLNQRYAQDASASGDYATIDLSEASDRVSLKLVECFLDVNREWLSDLFACRSPFVTLPDGSLLTYRKFSPMGSAVTFPLQSLIYYSMCMAAICINDGLRPSYNLFRKHAAGVRVFGDDIIIATRHAGVLSSILEHFHLKVNHDKSFWTGKFRESCGMDAYDGVDVTPPRVLEVPNGNLAQVSSLVETSNNFYRKGFWNTSVFIASHLESVNHLIPCSSYQSFAISYTTFQTGVVTNHKVRYNPSLFRDEMRVLVPQSRMKEGKMSPRARLLQYFIEKPSAFTNWKSGFALGYTVKNRVGWVPITPTDHREEIRKKSGSGLF